MRRRTLLTTIFVSPLATPAIVRAAGSSTLRIVPDRDLASLDPVWTTDSGVRDHGYMVFDTLYGMDDTYRMQPQMVAGHVVENEGRLWTITLRDGLKFHDAEPVRGRDVTASIRRFAARDAFGAELLDVTDELSAPDDRTIRFRLKRPFPLLPDVLGKAGQPMPCIMPERLALTDPSKQVTEMTGSGPFRFVANEHIAGARVVYERNADYVPRPDGPATFTAGPKRVHFDRVEWDVMPDSSTKANALGNGEVDWLQAAPYDLIEMLRGNKQLRLSKVDPAGSIDILRFNHLYPPFDNPAIRRALLGAIDQSEFMAAAVGDDRSLWTDKVAVFSPGTPFDSKAGIEVMTGKRDLERVKREIMAAGYKGETVVLLGPADTQGSYAQALVATDLLRHLGMTVDLQTIDRATMVLRRASKQPPESGGWNIFIGGLAGTNNFSPASQLGIRGNGKAAWFGWPTMPRMEALRQDWFDAPDLVAQRRICTEIEKQFWIDAPYIPLGCEYYQTAYSTALTQPRIGFLQAYDVMRHA